MVKWKSLNLLLIGGILGMMVAGTSVYGAGQIKDYILKKVDYPIILDSKEYKKDNLLLLNYNGTTYVPLKAFSDMLHVPVKWNADKKQVEIESFSGQMHIEKGSGPGTGPGTGTNQQFETHFN